MNEGGSEVEGELLAPSTFRHLNYLLILIFLAFIFGTLLLPGVFYDSFIYPYLWAPVLSDAGRYAGTPPGYNTVNTLTYGILLVISLLYIHTIFVRLKVRMDRSFFISISPLLLAGPIMRVLEDAQFLTPPSSYLFISPLIYVYLGLTALLAVCLSTLCDKGCSMWRGYISITPSFITPSLFLLFSLTGHLRTPLWPFLALILILIVLPPLYISKWRRTTPLLIFSFANLSSALLPFLFAPWKGWPTPVEVNLGVAFFAIGGALLTAFSIHLIFSSLRSRGRGKHPDPGGVNSAIVFGHTLDALATAWAVSYLSYSEKHVVPRFLFRLFGTSFIMIPVKITLVIAVLYILDVYMMDERRRYPTLFAILKLTLLVLGLGPGVRDVLRASLGI